MNTIKAIETRYAGYRFRSRLEARWAVFFDALGLQWEYEPEGFETDAGWYLPDFRVQHLGWFEVKPLGGADSPKDVDRWKAFVTGAKVPLHILEGPPDARIYQAYEPGREADDIGYLLFEGAFIYDSKDLDAIEVEFCFRSKYLPPHNHDTTPRLFHQPGCIEDATGDPPIHAIAKARSARFEHGERP